MSEPIRVTQTEFERLQALQQSPETPQDMAGVANRALDLVEKGLPWAIKASLGFAAFILLLGVGGIFLVIALGSH